MIHQDSVFDEVENAVKVGQVSNIYDLSSGGEKVKRNLNQSLFSSESITLAIKSGTWAVRVLGWVAGGHLIRLM